MNISLEVNHATISWAKHFLTHFVLFQCSMVYCVLYLLWEICMQKSENPPPRNQASTCCWCCWINFNQWDCANYSSVSWYRGRPMFIAYSITQIITYHQTYISEECDRKIISFVCFILWVLFECKFCLLCASVYYFRKLLFASLNLLHFISFISVHSLSLSFIHSTSPDEDCWCNRNA